MVKRTVRWVWMLGGLLVAGAAPASAEEGGVTVRFVATGLGSTEGTMRCGLYRDEDNWLTTTSFDSAEGAPRADGTAACVFEGVPPGRYAISAFHDENDNGVLDRGVFGIPREDYATSNDAYRRMGPPRWSEALFPVGREDLELTAPVH